MTEMDVFTRLELEALRGERAKLAEMHEVLHSKTVAAVREMYSRGYSDQDIADVLQVTRKSVSTWRRHGHFPPKKQGESETPALDSAG